MIANHLRTNEGKIVPKKALLLITAVCIGLIIWLTYENPKEKANKLYVKACQIMRKREFKRLLKNQAGVIPAFT
jgi:hypothetical protein